MASLPRPTPRPISLESLAPFAPGARVHGARDRQVTGVELDSRQVRAGDLFAALPGHHTHGADYVDAALGAGAVAILTDPAGWERVASRLADAGVPALVVEHPRAHLGALAREVYGRPTDSLTMLGVTGTNGKTTVAAMLEAGLREAGAVPGLVGTVGIRFADQELPSARTTPESPHLQALLALMVEAGVTAVAMEVSSHAVCEGRVDAVRFDVIGFTNLTQDHLDYHGSMEGYFEAKAALFTPSRSTTAVVGIDDAWGQRLAREATVPVQTWSLRDDHADWHGRDVDGNWQICGPNAQCTQVHVAMPGDFNRANAVLALGMLAAAGVDTSTAARGIEAARVPGRMESVGVHRGVMGLVDYAHSPDAIERVLTSVRSEVAGRVIVVLGAGGDRDRTKRVEMGRVAGAHADLVFVTDDNPRSEDPALIRAEVVRGARAAHDPDSVWEIADRREAIAAATASSIEGDLVVVLGKGHEQGQEVAGVMHPFDDRTVLRAALEAVAS